MKEVGLEYYNCADNVLARDVIENLRLKRRTAITRHSEKNKLCTKLLKENKDQLNKTTVSISIQRWINESCCANIVINKCSFCKKNVLHNGEKDVSVCKLASDKLDYACKGTDIFKISSMGNLQEKYEVCCNKGYEAVKYEKGFQSKRYTFEINYSTNYFINQYIILFQSKVQNVLFE